MADRRARACAAARHEPARAHAAQRDVRAPVGRAARVRSLAGLVDARTADRGGGGLRRLRSPHGPRRAPRDPLRDRLGRLAGGDHRRRADHRRPGRAVHRLVRGRRLLAARPLHDARDRRRRPGDARVAARRDRRLRRRRRAAPPVAGPDADDARHRRRALRLGPHALRGRPARGGGHGPADPDAQPQGARVARRRARPADAPDAPARRRRPRRPRPLQGRQRHRRPPGRRRRAARRRLPLAPVAARLRDGLSPGRRGVPRAAARRDARRGRGGRRAPADVGGRRAGRGPDGADELRRRRLGRGRAVRLRRALRACRPGAVPRQGRRPRPRLRRPVGGRRPGTDLLGAGGRMTPNAGSTVLDPAAEDTWLIDHAVRARLHEVSGRPRTARQVVFVLELLVLLVCVPELGWWPVATLPVVVCAFLMADRLMGRVEHAGVVSAAAWSLAQVVVAASAAVTGGPDSPLLMWLGIPIATGVGRFTPRGLAAGVALSAVLLLAATLGVDAQRVLDAPYTVAFPLSLVFGIALVGSALMRSEVEHRADAIVDPLTQMLNRKALAARGRELALQSEISGRPVGVVLGDLDHFKAINDREGHQVGDAVLREIAYRWRTTLRAYDLAYRLGGEEFVILLPGATEAEARGLAEKLRAAVRDAPIAGQHVTMSFGVAVSGPGGFDLDAHYARADEALYEAKRTGRDRVVVSAGPAPPAVIAA